MNETFLLVYVFVWVALGLGVWILIGGLDPKRKKVWQPRIGLVTLGVLAIFFLGPLLLGRNWLGAALLVLAFAALTHFGILKTRVCESCGMVTRPQSLGMAAKFCSKCGEKLSRTRIWGKES